MQIFIIITTGKISTNKKPPDMFKNLKHVGAKIRSTELKLVLCCHLVDSGRGKCFAAKHNIYIHMIMTDEIMVFLSINYLQ